MTTIQNLTLYQWDTLNLLVTAQDQNNNPINLTGATITFAVMDTNNSTRITKTTSNGISITSATSGQFQIPITQTDTGTTLPVGNYTFKTRVTDQNGNSQIVLTGSLTIQQSSI